MFIPPRPHLCSKLLRLIILIGGIFISSPLLQADVVKAKAAMDLVYTFKGYILRFRPIDYVSPSGAVRIDALIGRRFGWFTAYLYGKINSNDQKYLGLRLDTTIDIQDRVKLNFQTRGFIGLNQNSPDHLYFITTLDCRLDPKGRFRLGLMEYGIKELGGSTVMYVGPAITVGPSQFWSFRLSYGDDLLNSNRLWYGKLTLYL